MPFLKMRKMAPTQTCKMKKATSAGIPHKKVSDNDRRRFMQMAIDLSEQRSMRGREVALALS